MARTPLNALQAILIRERLIVCFQIRKSELLKYNVRKLIEDIALSSGNEGEARAYQEDQDREDEGQRFDSGLTLKHSTVDNLLNRRSSSISDDNLRLISNFLQTEGYLSAETLSLCGDHPDLRLQKQFGGLATTDARLQRYRRALEGEYRFIAESQVLWVAAPGRSKPFVSLRAVSAPTRASHPLHKTAFSASSERYEGRLFLMPGNTVSLIEMSTASKTWDGNIYRVAARGNAIELLNELTGSRSFERAAPSLAAARGLRAAIGKALASLRFRWQVCRERDRKVLKALQRLWAPHPAVPSQFNLQHERNAALIEAAKTGKASTIVNLLAQGADINFREPKTGRTAAHWAAATNALDKVYALTCRHEDEAWVLSEHLPDIYPQGEVADFWREARMQRLPLIADDEGCLASALALASTDDSERNRTATAIWRYLMQSEAEYIHYRFGLPTSALLAIWKPSTLMVKAMQRYAAPLPAGFADP